MEGEQAMREVGEEMEEYSGEMGDTVGEEVDDKFQQEFSNLEEEGNNTNQNADDGNGNIEDDDDDDNDDDYSWVVELWKQKRAEDARNCENKTEVIGFEKMDTAQAKFAGEMETEPEKHEGLNSETGTGQEHVKNLSVDQHDDKAAQKKGGPTTDASKDKDSLVTTGEETAEEKAKRIEHYKDLRWKWSLCIPPVFTGPCFDENYFQYRISIQPVVQNDLRQPGVINIIKLAQSSGYTRERRDRGRVLELFVLGGKIQELFEKILFTTFCCNYMTITIERRRSTQQRQLKSQPQVFVQEPVDFTQVQNTVTFKQMNSYARHNLLSKQGFSRQSKNHRSLFLQDLPPTIDVDFLRILFPRSLQAGLSQVSGGVRSAVLEMNNKTTAYHHLICFTDFSVDGRNIHMSIVNMSQEEALKKYAQENPAWAIKMAARNERQTELRGNKTNTVSPQEAQRQEIKHASGSLAQNASSQAKNLRGKQQTSAESSRSGKDDKTSDRGQQQRQQVQKGRNQYIKQVQNKGKRMEGTQQQPRRMNRDGQGQQPAQSFQRKRELKEQQEVAEREVAKIMFEQNQELERQNLILEMKIQKQHLMQEQESLRRAREETAHKLQEIENQRQRELEREQKRKQEEEREREHLRLVREEAARRLQEIEDQRRMEWEREQKRKEEEEREREQKIQKQLLMQEQERIRFAREEAARRQQEIEDQRRMEWEREQKRKEEKEREREQMIQKQVLMQEQERTRLAREEAARRQQELEDQRRMEWGREQKRKEEEREREQMIQKQFLMQEKERQRLAREEASRKLEELAYECQSEKERKQKKQRQEREWEREQKRKREQERNYDRERDYKRQQKQEMARPRERGERMQNPYSLEEMLGEEDQSARKKSRFEIFQHQPDGRGNQSGFSAHEPRGGNQRRPARPSATATSGQGRLGLPPRTAPPNVRYARPANLRQDQRYYDLDRIPQSLEEEERARYERQERDYTTVFLEYEKELNDYRHLQTTRSLPQQQKNIRSQPGLLGEVPGFFERGNHHGHSRQQEKFDGLSLEEKASIHMATLRQQERHLMESVHATAAYRS